MMALQRLVECRGGDADGAEEEVWVLCGSLEVLAGGGAVFEGRAAVKGGDGVGDEEETTWAVYMVATDAKGNMQQLPTQLLASSSDTDTDTAAAAPVVARRRSRGAALAEAVLIEPWEAVAAAAASGERCGVGLDSTRGAQCRFDAADLDLTPNATA